MSSDQEAAAARARAELVNAPSAAPLPQHQTGYSHEVQQAYENAFKNNNP